MIKQWVTVVAWQNGKALLRYETQSSCGQCAASADCGSRLLNKLVTAENHLISLDYPTPLQSGQKVELAIGESSLLGSACLAYLPPLAGLLGMAILFQSLFNSDIAALAGALCGGCGGFILARGGWQKLNARYHWQPVIVRVAPLADRVDCHATSNNGINSLSLNNITLNNAVNSDTADRHTAP